MKDQEPINSPKAPLTRNVETSYFTNKIPESIADPETPASEESPKPPAFRLVINPNDTLSIVRSKGPRKEKPTIRFR